MKRIWKYFFLLLSTSVNAQNLVPNSSFEDTVSCPNNLDQVNRAIGWTSYLNSPDYFNSCSFSIYSSVPLNNFGFVYPQNGNAYVGLHALHYHECIGIKLKDTLTVGQNYFASFYVSKASRKGFRIATNKLGIRLSTVPYSAVPIDNYAQIFSDSIITDSLNWFKISGSFKADSLYSFLSIGNFFNDTLTSIINPDSSSFAYYYVDNIVLTTDSNFTEDETLPIVKYRAQIKIFPNPALNCIIIEGDDLKSIILFNAFGEKCMEDNFAISSYHKIDISFLPRGIYFMQISTSKTIANQKIILII